MSKNYNLKTAESTKIGNQGNDEDGVRDPYFEQYNNQYYQELQANPSLLFNFFYVNNPVFKKINLDDYQKLQLAEQQYEVKTNQVLISSYIGIGLLDFFVLRHKVGKNIKNGFVRFFYAISKYIVAPGIAVGLAHRQYSPEHLFFEAACIYNFNYDDFQEGMKVFEKARLAGCLDELLENREIFDLKRLDHVKLKETSNINL